MITRVTVQFVSLGRLLLWFITIFTEYVSGTKAGDAKAHDCTLPGIFLFID
ncbi:hypothetical protein [Clostridium sp. AM54-14XD]|uniref:hypothetical protein n=1 Tax=Clostridium sp. AM54-14XD TaxID=2293037 RepID=UPI001A9AA8D9|nr:hypothetical protein [Clostridium sp. AM54-14XD]